MLNHLRLNELLAALSLAIDLGVGQPMEWVLRSCLLGVHLSRALGLSEAEQQQVYYLALLRHIGCTANAAQDAALFGDELGLAPLMTADPDDMLTLMKLLVKHVGRGETLLRRAQLVAGIMAGGTKAADTNHLAQCEVAVQMAAALGLDPALQTGLWQMFERWDGRGIPHHLKGDALLPSIRVVHLAQEAATFYSLGGLSAAVEAVQARAGRLYDPAIADVFCQQAAQLLPVLDVESVWDAVLDSEPSSPIVLTHEQFDEALQAVADFGDFKTPHTCGHSRAVAELGATAAQHYGLPSADIMMVRRAGLLHDLGRVAISAALWCKTGRLTPSEQERVRLHPYYTERIFAHSPTLAPLAAVAGLHHEHLDGSGYYRGMKAVQLSPTARVLGAANTYCALTETRPHRPQHTPQQAADVLRQEGRSGRLDQEAVHAVLTATGHRLPAPRRSSAAELSPREIEVLRLMVRGFTNRQMAQQLSIAEKTVGHHIQHIYNKIGVSTRAGAALFAMQNHLLTDSTYTSQ